MRTRFAGLAIVIAAIVIGWFTHRQTLGIGLFGIDTYPAIAASRIGSLGDFLDTFREILAGGRIQARFYRPVQNLMLAMDYAIGGLEPLSYHLTTLCSYSFAIAMLFVACRRLLGERAWLGPIAATAFFMLHPIFVEMMPIPLRRSEYLVAAFWFAALAVLPRESENSRWWRGVIAGVCIWLAAGCKDFGVAGAGLVILHQMLLGGGARRRRAVIEYARTVLPALFAAALYLVNRAFVVGGVGGYGAALPGTYTSRLVESLHNVNQSLLCRWWFFNDWSATHVALGSAAILGTVTLAALVLSIRSREPMLRDAGRELVLCLGWIGVALAVLGLSRTYFGWYAFLPFAGLAYAIGVITQIVSTLLRTSGWRRGVSMFGAAGLACVVAVALYGSPLFHDFKEWRDADKVREQMLTRLSALIREAHPGETVRAPMYRHFPGPTPSDRPHIERIPYFRDFGLDAWAELAFPDRRIFAVYSSMPHRPPPRSPAADEIRVLLYELPAD